MEPLALFGGTFDPVHYGHLRCADEARQKLNLNKLYLLPAGTPAHRAAPRASIEQRLAMLQLALLEFPFLSVDGRETRRDGPSYMVDTLQQLRTEFPHRPLILLIGQDAANFLHTWFNWEQLFRLAHIVILTRPGTKAKYEAAVDAQIQQRLSTGVQALVRTQAGTVLTLEVTAVDVSATEIKRIIHRGGLPNSMLPAAVLDYIKQNSLYLTA